MVNPAKSPNSSPDDREDEVAVRIRQDQLDDSLTRPSAEHAAVHKGLDRLVDLVGITAGGIQKAVDTAGHVR